MHNLIRTVANASGNDKRDLLQLYADKNFKEMLKYVYDPSIKFYMTSPVTEGQGEGWIDDTSYMLLDKLASRELSGQVALEVVCDHITELDASEANLFKKILNKDLRMGVGLRTINNIFPDLIDFKPQCQLVKNLNEKKITFPCYANPKFDGVRGLREDDFKTRQGKVLKGLDHLHMALEGHESMLDGELCVEGVDFDIASGLIRNHQKTPDAYYMVFDAPDIPGNLHNRMSWLKLNLKTNQHIRLVHFEVIQNFSELNAYYEMCINAGLEGIVIKNIKGEYKEGRSYDWMRKVPTQTADCKVVDVFEGKGKFEGTLGGLIVEYKGKEVKVGTGFTDAQREEIWVSDVTGCIAECEFKEETKAGSMRQPRFKGFRWDKNEVD